MDIKTIQRGSTQQSVGLAAWLESPEVQRSLTVLILLNALILGMETNRTVVASWGSWLNAADQAILAVFVLEIGLRLFLHRLAFFKDAWNVFDFLVVGIALIPASGPLSILRALRVLRVFRLVTLVPSMKRVIGGLLSALPGLGSVCAIIALIFYVSAVVATRLYGEQFPEWFGTLGATTFTLFQVMTLESWAMGIMRPIMDVFPMAWVFFLIFILTSTFTLLNLFIAVIVNAIQQEHLGETAPQSTLDVERLYLELAALRRQLQRVEAETPAKRGRVRSVSAHRQRDR